MSLNDGILAAFLQDHQVPESITIPFFEAEKKLTRISALCMQGGNNPVVVEVAEKLDRAEISLAAFLDSRKGLRFFSGFREVNAAMAGMAGEFYFIAGSADTPNAKYLLEAVGRLERASALTKDPSKREAWAMKQEQAFALMRQVLLSNSSAPLLTTAL